MWLRPEAALTCSEVVDAFVTEVMRSLRCRAQRLLGSAA
jgi:hypothetical protein